MEQQNYKGKTPILDYLKNYLGAYVMKEPVMEHYFNEKIYQFLNRRREFASFLLAKDYAQLESEYLEAEKNHPEEVPGILQKYRDTILPELIRMKVVNEEGEFLYE